MADAAFSAIPHFIGRAPLGNAFVTEIARVGILRFRQLFQDTLFVLGSLFDSFIKLVPRGVFYVLFPRRRKDTSPVLLLFGGCLKHGINLLMLAWRQ